MDRFSYTGSRRKYLPRISGAAWFVIVWAIILALFLTGLNTFGRYTADKQKESLMYALQRDIAQCYALEGIYPPDIDYLREHYGLIYDEALFYIDYRPIGSNLYPDVTVIDLR